MNAIALALEVSSDIARARLLGTSTPDLGELVDALDELQDATLCDEDCEDNRANLEDVTEYVQEMADATDTTTARAMLLRIMEVTKGISWAEKHAEGIFDRLTLKAKAGVTCSR